MEGSESNEVGLKPEMFDCNFRAAFKVFIRVFGPVWPLLGKPICSKTVCDRSWPSSRWG